MDYRSRVHYPKCLVNVGNYSTNLFLQNTQWVLGNEENIYINQSITMKNYFININVITFSY